MPSEFELIDALVARLRPTDAVVGPGDDAAVVALSSGLHVVTTDLLVEDVDFRRSWATPADIGFKAAAVTLSDIAAMGAQPRYITAAIGAASGDRELFQGLGDGLQQACEPFNCSVIGGDVSRSPVLLVATTGVGRVKARPILRSGALPGDLILCTGTLGDSAGGLLVLESQRPGHEALRTRQLRPLPRVAAGVRLGELGLATSMLDISDGLAQDLGHLCRSSHVAAAIWLEDLPISSALARFCRDAERDPLELATTGGEDFELLFTAAETNLFRIREALEELVPVRVIGEIEQARPGGNASPVRLLSGGRDRTDSLPWRGRLQGWDHFERRS